MISPFSTAEDWFCGSIVYGPDSSRSSCVAIILPYIFKHHSVTNASGSGDESMPNSGAFSTNPVTTGGFLLLLLLGYGYTTLHHPVEWAVQSQHGSQSGLASCIWSRQYYRGQNCIEISRQQHERQNKSPTSQSCSVEITWCRIYPLYRSTI